MRGNGWWRCCGLRAGEVLEVEGDPDSWAPPVSGRARKKRERRLRWAASGRKRGRSEAGG
jgi:hypothetical protein